MATVYPSLSASDTPETPLKDRSWKDLYDLDFLKRLVAKDEGGCWAGCDVFGEP